ncbi:hypothetical protein G3M48_002158 [Beauveria asiatica]|uniref:Hydrophobin n=1 Tax=Beauveria asiatica TaxID=1069075 RepID=A0AAW0S7S8_9HYPO
MKFIVFASLIVSALAVPAELAPRTSSSVCSSFLYSVPQCCATGIGSVVDLNCETPKEAPRSAKHLQEICSAKGQQAVCCTIPIFGQGILCTYAV